MVGRITLGLYNSYDPVHFHEAMRRAIARAAPLAAAFDYNLALFGFPFEAYKTKDGETPHPKTPQDLAALVADSTTIGEGGEYLLGIVKKGRFLSFPFPERGLPPQLGVCVLATREPEKAKQITLSMLGARLRQGESFTVLVGLGPRGVPKAVRELAPFHLELTGRGYSLETATALGVLAGRLHDAASVAFSARAPRFTADALVVRGDNVLLIRRGREPFQGYWALPGGFIDAGETMAEAALRELKEETGLKGRNARLLRVMDDPRRDPRGHTVTFVFLVDASGEPKGSDDAAEAAFHPLNHLPPLAFDHGEILETLRRQGVDAQRTG